MKTKMKYVAKQPDQQGHIAYSAEENGTWQILYERQLKTVQNRACAAFIEGIAKLNMPQNRVPQLQDLSRALQSCTGWSVAPVPALITHDVFFQLLSERKFPAATFIRRREELDYLEEPDIFHEFFGHCPLIAHQVFADFLKAYADLTLTFSIEKERELMARLFWFTVEFGLINSSQGPVCYGGGILSSHGETIYAVDSPKPQRQKFDILTALRTPYRIDIMQPTYFVIDDFSQLFDIIHADMPALLAEAKQLGEFQPTFPVATQKDKDNEEWVTC